MLKLLKKPSMQELKRIKEIILYQRGIDLSFYRETYLIRRVRVRMRKRRIWDIEEYLKKLEKDENEQREFINEIGINVSSFFRNRKTFEKIKQIVLPELRKKKKILIWSAGCAMGEEPYSLAILLREENINNYKIIATDSDSEVIKKAKEGVYTKEKVEEIPVKFLKKYFFKIN